MKKTDLDAQNNVVKIIKKRNFVQIVGGELVDKNNSTILAVTDAALAAKHVVQQDPITKAFQIGGVNINALTPVYDWGVNCPLPSALAPGSIIGISPDSFGGTWKTTVPIYLVSDGEKFKPVMEQMLFHAPGSAAAPISIGSVSQNVVSGVSSTFSLGAIPPSIPADFLAVIDFVSVYMHIIRGATSVGATPAYAVRLSTTNNINGGSAATIINISETVAGADRKAFLDGKAMITPDGYLTKANVYTHAAIGGSTTLTDAVLATTSLNYLVAGVQSGGTPGDFFDVQAYSFWIK